MMHLQMCSSSTPPSAADNDIVAWDEVRLVYHAARILRNRCLEDGGGAAAPVPVTGDVMPSTGGCTLSVPILLWNFLAWTLSDMHIITMNSGQISPVTPVLEHI
eukprot:scpid57541/ scgid7249/ 